MQLNLFTEKLKPATKTNSSKNNIDLSTALRQHSTSIDTALQGIFKSTQEESRLQQTRRIMGDSIDCLADEDLEVCLTEFQHLMDEWFDSFERELFDGQTLKQALSQG